MLKIMKLMELRIPQGFAIGYNKFCDVEPKQDEDGDGFLENWSYFTEDILQMFKMEIRDGKWIIPEKNMLIIDLGWYPDSSVDGQYRLVIANENWDILKEKSSKSRYEIKDTLEEWLKSLYTNRNWV